MAVGLVMLVTAQPPSRLTAQTIDTVIIENGNVFHANDGTPQFVAKLANSLHIRTRQWVIRHRLLLQKGDPVDAARLEETARALRGLGVFRFVQVDTVRPRPGGPLALAVVTADGWSTHPEASFTTAGGDKSWDIGFVEQNLLGTATELAVHYGSNPDRRRLEFDFLNPHFFGHRSALMLRYGRLSDGHKSAWQFGLPFNETGARRALETYGEMVRDTVRRFRDDSLVQRMSRRLFRVGLTGGVALHATTRAYARLWGGWEWRREDFDSVGITPYPYSVYTTFRAGVEFGQTRFRVLEHFNSFARREDVDLSPTLRLGALIQSGVGYEARGQASAVWNRGFALLRLEANGLDSTRTRGRLTIVSQNIHRHTLIAHLEAGRLTHPKPGAEFDLWIEQRGPRLFGVHDFTGTRMTWLALEDRILVVDDIWGLVAVGIAPFFDYGGAWYADEGVRRGGNAGVSLRFGPTRAVRGEAAEIAFGYRFRDPVLGRKGWAITLRRSAVF